MTTEKNTAKKSFLDNPALQFITAPEPEEPTEQVTETVEVKADVPAKGPNTPPAGYKMNPMYVETKSRRLQLVLQPSLYERVKKAAQKEGKSVNEYVHHILDQATPKE